MNDREDTKLYDCATVVPVSTVQGWKQRDAIPENRVGDILAAAETHNVDLAKVVAVSGPDEAPPASTTETPSEPKPKAPIRGSSVNGDRGAVLIAVAALVVAVGVGGWVILGGGGQRADTAPGTDFSPITQRLDALETAARSNGAGAEAGQQFADDIAELRAEIDRLAETQTGIAAPTTEIDELTGRLQTAETEIDQIQRQAASDAEAAKAASAAAQDEIEKLRDQLAALGESRSVTGQNVAGAVGMALAAGRLQRAIDNGDAYEAVLATLRALSAGDATAGAILDRLAGRAATGTPTRDVLAQSFPGVARAVAAAADTESASGWTDRTLQRIKNTVSIRRIGADVPGDTPGARVARAEVKLNGGDLGGAIAELDGLTGAAATAAASWLGDARARHDAEAAVGELEALAVARLQAGAGGS
jgi:hypothetical protein